MPELPPLFKISQGIGSLLGMARPVVEPTVAAFLREVPRPLLPEGLAKRVAKGYLTEPLVIAGRTADEVFWNQYRKLERDLSMERIKSYFSHETYGTTRRAVAWAGAGLLTANILGMDPLGATTAGNFVAKAGFNLLVGRAIMHANFPHSKLLGLGYLGLATYNAATPGNQFGPF